MRGANRDSSTQALGRAKEIEVYENPDGVYVASLKGRSGVSAEGATAAEAERQLMDYLDQRYDEGAVLHRTDLAADPDEAPLDEE